MDTIPVGTLVEIIDGPNFITGREHIGHRGRVIECQPASHFSWSNPTPRERYWYRVEGATLPGWRFFWLSSEVLRVIRDDDIDWMKFLDLKVKEEV